MLSQCKGNIALINGETASETVDHVATVRTGCGGAGMRWQQAATGHYRELQLSVVVPTVGAQVVGFARTGPQTVYQLQWHVVILMCISHSQPHTRTLSRCSPRPSFLAFIASLPPSPTAPGPGCPRCVTSLTTFKKPSSPPAEGTPTTPVYASFLPYPFSAPLHSLVHTDQPHSTLTST